MLLGSGRLLEAHHWRWHWWQRFQRLFHIVKDRIRSMSKYEKVHIALFFPYMLKHTVGDFASRLRFSGEPQAAFQSLKAFWRHLLMWVPQGDCGSWSPSEMMCLTLYLNLIHDTKHQLFRLYLNDDEMSAKNSLLLQVEREKRVPRRTGIE